MSNEEIKRRVASLVDDVIRDEPDEEGAALASLLLAILSVQRHGRVVKAAHALWGFIDMEGEASLPAGPPD